MTISQGLQFAIEKLNNADIKSAVLDSEILLSDVLNMPIGKLLPPLTPPLVRRGKAFLYSHADFELNKSHEKLFKKYILRRSQHEPVAYILNKKEFYGLNFFVNKHVLIPRPETETLVEEVLSINNQQLTINNILEIGTGSGCIIISIIKNRLTKNKINYMATDVSKKALKIAKKNARKHGVENKINFIKSDLLKNKKVRKFNPHIIVANLPYLDMEEKNLLNSSDTLGLKFEPQIALWSGKDGFDHYRKLFKQIKKYNLRPQYILIEIGNIHKTLLEKMQLGKEIKFIKDLNGTDRVAKIKLN